MSENKDDKQFDPSEQKLQKARQDGDVPRSTEVNVLGMYLGTWLVFAVGGGYATRQWLTSAERALGSDAWLGEPLHAIALSTSGSAAVGVIGLMMVPALTILIALVAQRGLVFSVKKIAFDPKRLNPLKNAGQKFGPAGLVTFGISFLKAALVCLGGWYLFSSFLSELATTMAGRGGQWIPGLPKLLQDVLTMAVSISAVFAIIDLLWKRQEHLRRHRMSRKEMEDEHKSSEGDPHIKAKRRQKAVELAMKQMLNDVAKADVIIVNPAHYAVALEWKRGSGRAPVCVAKGTDDVAERIRAKAREHQVPIHSDPPCARALHATVGLGEEIRREHFAAVAIAIRFAEDTRKKARSGW